MADQLQTGLHNSTQTELRAMGAKSFAMKRTLADQVRAFIEWRGDSYSLAKMADEVAKHQRDLPEKNRCKRQNIEQLLGKNSRTVLYMIPLAKAMGTTAECLAAGRFYPGKSADESPVPVVIPVSLRDPPPEGYVRMPSMAEAGAGEGREPLPEVVQYVDVLESYIRQRLNVNPQTIKVLTARGNSMTGQIEDGDIMFVQPTNEFTDDGIYVLTLDNLVRVKRLSVSIASGVVSVESNDGRQPEKLPLKEVQGSLHIQGRVIAAWSLRRFP
jgi:phage repressor protein C with HTH and peptisase S24 domain